MGESAVAGTTLRKLAMAFEGVLLRLSSASQRGFSVAICHAACVVPSSTPSVSRTELPTEAAACDESTHLL
jgi:hypothetical protein